MKTFLVIMLWCSFALAQNHYDYQIDNTVTVGPGMVHKHVRVPEKLWNIDILEINLSNPYVKIETVKAKDALKGRERTTAMAKRRSFSGHQVVGAINGDFFNSEGVPINIQIAQGQILRGPSPYSTMGWDSLDHPCLNIVSLSGSIISKGGNHSIDGVNKERGTDQTILYNSFNGSTTGTNKWGIEVLVKPITPWIVNDTVWAVAQKSEKYIGSMAIPKDMAVLSAHGNAIEFLEENVQVGDTVGIALQVQPTIGHLTEMIGGYPKIVFNGRNWAQQGYQEEGGPSHAFQVHPRTGIGFSQDSTKLFFFTVDGRKEGVYKGMTLPELANVMIDFGVAQGLNLDGGGSTTFVVWNQIKNHPSDGSERGVANAVLAISKAPTGNFGTIQIEPDNIQLYYKDKRQFTVSGWDTYFNPYPVQSSQVTYSTDSSLGTISSDGLFQAKVNGGSGYVYARYENSVDSAFVKIEPVASIDLQPEFAVTDTIAPLQLTVTAYDSQGKALNLPTSSFSLKVLNPTVGTVDENGKFYGNTEGETNVIATLDTLTDTVTVKVEIGVNKAVLDSMEHSANWQLDGQNYDSTNSALQEETGQMTFGHKALRLDYAYLFSKSKPTYFYLKRSIPIYGVPDSIGVDFKSDGNYHKLYFVVSDNDGELFKTHKRGYLVDSTRFVAVMHPTSSLKALNNSADFHYPIQFQYIRFKPGTKVSEGSTANGQVYFDYLRVSYPTVTSLIPLVRGKLPKKVRLLPNVPNPFNPTTYIRFELSASAMVQINVYDIRGRKVAELLHQKLNGGFHRVQWDATKVASGVYFCRLKVGPQVLSQKMILVH